MIVNHARYLTLDLGSDAGWCIDRPGRMPELGTWNLRAPSKHPGAMYCNLADLLWAACVDDPPEKIIYEAPFMMIPKKDDEGRGGNAATLERLISLTVPPKQVACRLGIPVHHVAVSSARRTFCGNGRASKEDVYDEAIRRGWKPKNMHESDAAAVADHCVQLFHPEEWARANPQLAVERSMNRRR